MLQEVTIRDLSNFLLEYASTLLGAGVHTGRAVRNISRIAESFGYQADMTIFQRNITMSVIQEDDDSIRRTSVRKIRQMPIDFAVISRLSALSWRAFDERMPLEQLQKEYGRIMERKRIPLYWLVPMVALANAAFCRLFQGDYMAMGIVFVATLIGFLLKHYMTRLGFNHMAVFVLSAFSASLVAAFGVQQGLGNTPDIALATSVLFLVPGVPLINSIMDLLNGHVLMGISRAVNAGILIICIALGLSASMFILGLNAL